MKAALEAEQAEVKTALEAQKEENALEAKALRTELGQAMQVRPASAVGS